MAHAGRPIRKSGPVTHSLTFLRRSCARQQSRPETFNVLGMLFLAISVNGLVLVGAADWVEPMFNDAALLVAVTLSTAIARRRGRADVTPLLATLYLSWAIFDDSMGESGP